SLLLLRPPRPTLFPYTTLFRSPVLLHLALTIGRSPPPAGLGVPLRTRHSRFSESAATDELEDRAIVWMRSRQEPNLKDLIGGVLDRKSTRLNSSHVKISYAVFC